MQVRFIFVVALMLSLCFPALSSTDADNIFKENRKAVVVVVENKTPIFGLLKAG